MVSTKGRSTRNFRRLSANLRSQRRACCLCGQPIDYTLEYPDPGSFTVQHILSRSTHPHLAEDPGNLDAAHKRCNEHAGNSNEPPGLGDADDQW